MSKKEKKKMANQTSLPLEWEIHRLESKNVKEPASELMKTVATRVPIKNKMLNDFSHEEIKEIEDRIKIHNEKEAKRKEELTEEKIERKKKIIAIKKKAKEMEKGNKAKVIVFPSYSRDSDMLQWYKLGDFSAMYYVYRMAARMGRTAKLQRDTDKFSKMQVIASIKGIDKFVDSAMKLGIFERFDKTEDGFYIFYLKKELTDEEVGILRRTEAMRREMMHNVLKPKKADAAIYQAILMIDRQVLPRVSNMQKGYYLAIGDKLAKAIYELTVVYFRFANGYIEVDEAKKTLLDLVEWIIAGTALLGEIDAWGYDVATSIGENANNLKKIVQEIR